MSERTETPSDDGGEPGSSAPADAEQPPGPPVRRADTSTAAQADAGVGVDLDPAVAASDLTRLIDRAWIAARLAEAARSAAVAVDRVRVLILDDAGMTELHRRHVGENAATDVLTFPNSDAGDPIDADIAIGAEVAARQASDRGHSISQELLLYALHGVLHCAGRNDHDPDAYRAMHDEEDRILRAIGVGATFSSQPRSTGAAT
jgi:probable rRNA maturation factor